MVTNSTYEYGIKYRVIKISPNKYLMIPLSLEGGLSDGLVFSTNDDEFKIANEKKDLKNKCVVDNVFLTEDLEEAYELYDDTEILSQYFFLDYKDTVYLVDVLEDNTLKKYAIDLTKFKEKIYDMTYHLDKDVPAITVNEDILNDILAIDDVDKIKLVLKNYKSLLSSFSDFKEKSGVTTVNVRNGHVESFQTVKSISNGNDYVVINDKDKSSSNIESYGGVDVSYLGLRKAIKEKVFGHDEEIDTIAQKLYMNYTAEDNEAVESIMIVGPTGTGKTETVKAACDYLGIPFVNANAANLVPQGIKGISIEDILIDLYELSGRDIKKAQRGLVFLDEFDKLNESDLDYKRAIKSILLSFNGGEIIPVRNDDYDFMFNSSMTNKVFAGVFERINNKKKTLGFGVDHSEDLFKNSDEVRQKIIDSGYFSLEELSRINTIIFFNELSREDKKRILLYSKLSIFAKKRERYKRQFGIDLQVSDEYIDAILDSISNSDTGMRSVNNFVKRSIDSAEKTILENEEIRNKSLILTKDTVDNPSKFNLT